MKKSIVNAALLGSWILAAAVPALAGNVSPVPEPSTVLLLGGGLGALILYARKKRK